MSSANRSRKKVCRPQPAPADAATPPDPEALAEIRALFGKVRTYAKPPGGEWSLPGPNAALRHPPPAESEAPGRLRALKASLNDVKNRLSDKNVQVWHQHTNSTNRAGKVIAAVRSAANAEICTQAWCKFYEILGTFRILPEEALRCGELNTVHLCEAPGAFISALNHFLKTSESTRYCDWTWAANTLNPYHEANAGGTAIADDRLVANTLPWWFFGSDNTGDITLRKHLLELRAFVGNMRRVDVVTADGSFDCQEKPDQQEALVASLHHCEAAAALLLLSPGGSLVLKMFTLYEHASVCLLYLLNCCFAAVSVFKPATSKAGNSEVYVVCRRYHAKEEARPLLAKLLRRYGPRMAEGEALFPPSLIPPSFLAQHEETCAYFHALQVGTIEENLRLFEGVSAERRRRLEGVRDRVAQEYLQRFQVSFLPRSRWLSRNTVSPACCSVSAGRPLGQKKQTGSFNERRELQTLSWRERVRRGCHADWIQRHCDGSGGAGCALEGPPAAPHVDSWYVIEGAALPAVTNSPFCEGGLLSQLNEALAARDPSPDWPACRLCTPPGAASVLSDVAGLCGGGGEKKRCLLFGGGPPWDACGSQIEDLVLTFPAEAPCPAGGRPTLHDGDPRYQHQLSGRLLRSLRTLGAGEAVLLPVLSALTRVTAGLVLCLQLCFRSVTFRCPPPSGVAAEAGALLLCGGFCPEAAARILPALGDVHRRMGRLLGEEEEEEEEEEEDASGERPAADRDRQVLQFVPMEELLAGGLTDFLWTMNSEIIRQKLHVLMQA